MSQRKNMLIAQSGGPTAVINASVVGAFHRAVTASDIHHIYGAYNGIVGVLKETFVDLKKQDRRTMDGIQYTPSSALGSCRYKLSSDFEHEDYRRIFDVFDAHKIGYFFYNGGNDSMDTAMKLNAYARKIGYDIKIIGIPKTIDNDLVGTDHCPGYGSAAKYINTSILESAFDCNTYTARTVVLIEVMGRHAGWLAASASLAAFEGERIVDLVYLPELPFDLDTFLSQVEEVYREKGKVFVAVSEGIRDKSGEFILAGQSQHDEFGHSQLGGVSLYLQEMVQANITKRVKVINPGILQRCAAHCASKTDLDEAYWIGYRAVDLALQGYTGFMAGIKRESNRPYKWSVELTALENVANKEKAVPREWIVPEGNYVTEECIEYMKPLIMGEVYVPAWEGLPRYVQLKKDFIPPKLEKWHDEKG